MAMGWILPISSSYRQKGRKDKVFPDFLSLTHKEV
jgi:hypothetical protein